MSPGKKVHSSDFSGIIYIQSFVYPNPLHEWESKNVFNTVVTQLNGLLHMHYRAQGVDYVSRIGYAVSIDGLHWNRLENPVLVPHNGREGYLGAEDPRVPPLDGTFYMTYNRLVTQYIAQPFLIRRLGAEFPSQ